MILDLVPYKVANDLRKLGFDWPVSWVHFPGGGTGLFKSANHNEDRSVISAPNQSEAAKWLREACQIHVSVEYYDMWEVAIIDMTNLAHERYSHPLYSEDDFDTFDQAQLKGIKEAVGILMEREQVHK